MININCNICGKDNTDILLNGHDRYMSVDNTSYTLVKCKNCGLVYISPQPTLSELGKYYPTDYPPYVTDYKVFSDSKFIRFAKKIYSLFKNKKAEPIINKKTEQDQSSKKVLDFGCGRGHLLLALQKQHPNWELYGFDIATNQEVKNIGHNIHIHLDDFSRMEENFEAKSFDLIYLNNVLEHVHDPKDIINRLSHILKDDGEIVIEIPNIDAFKFKLFGKNFSSLDIPRHLYHFSPDTIEKLCKKCNMNITEIKFAGTTKSTVLSLYYFLGIKNRQLNPIIFNILQRLTKLIGKDKIDNDSMIIKAKKIL